MGLNSIRLVGLGGLDYNENSDVTIKLYNSSGEFNSFPYSVIKADYIAAVVKIIELAKSNGLKVMILLPTHRLDEKENESRISFIKDILSLFKDENTVFSYDFLMSRYISIIQRVMITKSDKDQKRAHIM